MTYTHAIVYVGAPYGDNEAGHIISRHKSFANAERRFERESRTSTGERTTFPLNHQIVALNADGSWTRSDAAAA